ncbi:hypothetical protein NI456_03125 [Brevundimonas diminuta]|uniref:hypothetical protein n=1 Tax=Brevundimonas diminuta TaxID=293 RepID=UPI0020973185|nr:hypothetical protein [Brevundimonas diminuta]MCO8017848.1 hypothetical protein [Brevundimonas diminuta]MCO8021368.1 hypothetical protein [Brevundimonas diminuta]
MSRAAMLPSWTYRHKGLLSFAPVAAWTPGAVEPCIYCQLRRSVIGLLGLKGLALRRLGRLIEVDEVSSSLRPNRLLLDAGHINVELGRLAEPRPS